MMPPGHLVFALGAVQLGRRAPFLPHRVDWRVIAIASLLPDFIDKSLSLLVFPLIFSHAHATRLVAHALLPSLLLLAVTLLFRPGWLVYALAFGSHLIADQIHLHTWPAEYGALVVLAWLIHRYRLWRLPNLRYLLQTGRVPDSPTMRIRHSPSIEI